MPQSFVVLSSFLHSLRTERQIARMSRKIKRVGYTTMALNTLKCNHLTPLGLKGLICF